MEHEDASPNVILAWSPWDVEKQVALYCRPTKLRELRVRPWNAKLGEYAGLVHGGLPDRVGAALLGAYALYRGLKRPMNEAALENRVYAYVSLPSRSFLWPASGDMLVPFPRPDKAVFATYVHIPEDGETAIDEMREDAAKHLVTPALAEKVRGEVLYWEWTLAAGEDASLPEFAGSRYVTEVWRRQ